MNFEFVVDKAYVDLRMETTGVGVAAGAFLGVLVLYQLLMFVVRRRRFISKVDMLPGPKPHPIFGNVPDLMVPPNSKWTTKL